MSLHSQHYLLLFTKYLLATVLLIIYCYCSFLLYLFHVLIQSSVPRDVVFIPFDCCPNIFSESIILFTEPLCCWFFFPARWIMTIHKVSKLQFLAPNPRCSASFWNSSRVVGAIFQNRWICLTKTHTFVYALIHTQRQCNHAKNIAIVRTLLLF